MRLKEANSEAYRCQDIDFYRKKHRCFKLTATLTYGKVIGQLTSNQCLSISSQLIYQFCVVLNHQSVVEAIEVDILNESLLAYLHWNMRGGSCPRFSSPFFFHGKNARI